MGTRGRLYLTLHSQFSRFTTILKYSIVLTQKIYKKHKLETKQPTYRIEADTTVLNFLLKGSIELKDSGYFIKTKTMRLIRCEDGLPELEAFT